MARSCAVPWPRHSLIYQASRGFWPTSKEEVDTSAEPLLQNVCESRHPLVRHKLTILRRTDAGDRLFGTKVEEAVRIPRTLEEP